MKTPKKEGKSPEPGGHARAMDKAIPRKRYVAPELVEYGSIAKLTQGTRTRKNDGANTRRQRTMCL